MDRLKDWTNTSSNDAYGLKLRSACMHRLELMQRSICSLRKATQKHPIRFWRAKPLILRTFLLAFFMEPNSVDFGHFAGKFSAKAQPNNPWKYQSASMQLQSLVSTRTTSCGSLRLLCSIKNKMKPSFGWFSLRCDREGQCVNFQAESKFPLKTHTKNEKKDFNKNEC